jgi:glycosyltransferase involved in cell wall biosynthesis
MVVAILIDGTFIPARDGASSRFSRLPAALARSGVSVVVFHAFRGWSDLDLIAREPYRTYVLRPETFYTDLTLLSDLMKDEEVSIIQANDLEMMDHVGLPLASTLDAHTVLEAHYHTSTLMSQLSKPRHQLELMAKLESRIANAVDEIVTFTPEDRSRWVAMSRAEGTRVSIVPFGVDNVQQDYRGCGETRSCQLVFIGNMYYEPNERAVERIVWEILPKVRQSCPSVTALVVGDLSTRLRDLCSQEGVSATGEVQNPDLWIRASAVGLAPITEGSGVRSKILHYLSCGLPVAATSIAGEGLCFPSLYIEDDADRYAQLCVRLLDRSEEVQQAVRKTAIRLKAAFLWDTIALQAIRVYNLVASRPRRHASHLTSSQWSEPMWLMEVLDKQRFSPSAVVPARSYRYGIAGEGRIAFYD